MIKLHRNAPQIEAELVDAQIECDIWGRRTGKTRGRTAGWIRKRAYQMPRSSGFLAAPTYAQLISKILPEVLAGWEELGWQRNKHFWLFKRPPEKLGIPDPIRPPMDAKYCIFFYNGSVLKLYSMDRNSLSNGDANDWGAFEECKLLDGVRVQQEIEPTISGTNPRHWMGKPYYCSRLYVTDQPDTAKGKWVLQFYKQVDHKRVQAILGLQLRRKALRDQAAAGGEKEAAGRQIAVIDETINRLRKGLVYVSEASTLDNIHVLGVDTIRQMKKTIQWSAYQRSVLNRKGLAVPNGFYAALDEQVHGYEAYNYAFIDRLQDIGEQDCRWDGDLVRNAPLQVTIDVNLAIVCITVYQTVGTTVKMVKSHYLLHPATPDELVDYFAEYYQPHLNKTVDFIYNSTFEAGKRVGNKTIADKFADRLDKAKWKVNRHALGQPWTHEMVYRYFTALCKGETPWTFRFNRHNCSVWLEASNRRATGR